MKRGGLLNAPLSHVVARLGHGQTLLICDAGMPCPPGVPVIDLAIVPGLPGFLAVVAAVLSELQVERYIVAEELAEQPGLILSGLRHLLRQAVEVSVPHEVLKQRSENCVTIVRTGECSAYANVLLHSGVTF